MQTRTRLVPKPKAQHPRRTRSGAKPARIHVGAPVWMTVGDFRVKALVIEDRGNIGVGGRQFIVVRIPPASKGEEPRVVEVPAEYVKLSR